MNYTKPLKSYGDLFTITDFKEACESGCIINGDGNGYWVKDEFMNDDIEVTPEYLLIPEDATHVIWFNK